MPEFEKGEKVAFHAESRNGNSGYSVYRQLLTGKIKWKFTVGTVAYLRISVDGHIYTRKETEVMKIRKKSA